MLKFIDENDFLLVQESGYFKESDDGSVSWLYQEIDGPAHSGFISEGFTRTDEEGNTVDLWQRLKNLNSAGTISIQWLTQADKDAAAAEAQVDAFKASRQQQLNSAIVTANGYDFDADEQSISRMANAILAAQADSMADTDTLQWSLADTGTGVMTDITLADLKAAHRAAVINMASIWSIN